MRRNIFLHITNDCNMSCCYCYNKNKPKTNDIDGSVIEKLTDVVNTLHQKNDKLRLTLIGGEPSIKSPVVKHILDTSNCDSFQIMTNGFYWDTLFKQTVLKHKNRVLITVSFDGLFQDTRAVGSSENVITNIKWIKENNLNGIITCTHNPFHKNHIFDNIKYLLSFGLNINYKRNCDHSIWGNNQDYLDSLEELETIFNPLIYSEYFLHQAISLPSRIEQGLTCNCCQRDGLFSCDEYVANDIVIDTDGTYYPCEVYAAHKLHPLGTIFQNDILNVLEKQNNLICKKSKHLNICPLYNELLLGDPLLYNEKTCNYKGDEILWNHRLKLQDLKKIASDLLQI